MREMKDSGVEWLGEVPAGWKITPIKHLFYISKNIAGRTGFDVLSITQQGLKVKDVKSGEGQLASDYSHYQIVEPGDFAMNHMDLLTGWIDLSDKTGVTSPDYRVFKARTIGINKRYYLRIFQYYYSARVFYGFCKGISNKGRWRLPADAFRAIQVPLPPRDEQRRIADYLDEKCAEIDRAVSVAEHSIEEYKAYKNSVVFQAVTKGLDVDVPMRDSGVEWLGEVPAEWGVVPGKRILMLLHRPVEDGDGVVTCFRDGEVTLRANRRTEGFTIALKEIGYQGVEPGDLVVHGMDGFAGSIGISDSRGKASPVLNVMGSDQNKRFLMYYMRGLAYRDVYMALSDGIRVRSCNLSWKKISNLPFALPSLPVQSRIADYLDEECAEIDRAVSAKQAIIADLKAYKQSLIYEVVTGKREV